MPYPQDVAASHLAIFTTLSPSLALVQAHWLAFYCLNTQGSFPALGLCIIAFLPLLGKLHMTDLVILQISAQMPLLQRAPLGSILRTFLVV